MTSYFPPVPQTGRQPITLTPDQEKRLLSRRVKEDRLDPFVNDSNETLRTLGKLARINSLGYSPNHAIVDCSTSASGTTKPL